MTRISSYTNPGNGLVICDNTVDWDEFCATSQEGSPFMQSWFVASASTSAIRYFWYKDSEPLAAILLPLKNGLVFHPLFSVHHSLCFANSVTALPSPEQTRKRYEILDSILQNLAELHGPLFWSFHPDISDIRPVQWHNFHTPEKGQYQIILRYTAIRSLLNFNGRDDLLLDIRKDRRADYKKSIKEGINISHENAIDDFLALYEMTFERQSIDIDTNTLALVKNILQSIQNRNGFILIARNRENTPVSATAILTGETRAYSLFTANHPAFRKLGANTALVIEAIMHAKALGLSEFDFVGANSPNRGDYKLSFNAELKSYFEANMV